MTHFQTVAAGLAWAGVILVAGTGSDALGQCARLTPSDAGLGDHFGRSVAISGNLAIVGCRYGHDCPFGAECDPGAAYIFRAEGTNWIEEARLVASDAADSEVFGHAVAISGGYAVVGAALTYGDDGLDLGSAYVFRREGTSWVEEARLTPDDGEECSAFGAAVAIEEDYLVVGAPVVLTGHVSDPCFDPRPPGSVYIFHRVGSEWIQEARLTASDGWGFNRFGNAVSISGEYAVVGAYGDDSAAYGSGTAYIFARNGDQWVEQTKLVVHDAEYTRDFGRSVSIDGTQAVVGAGSFYPSTFAAYMFEGAGSVWTEVQRLSVGDGTQRNNFGGSVSISGDRLVVGASASGDACPDDPDYCYSGAAYVFRREGADWVEQEKLLAFDAEEGDSLGGAVAVHGDRTIVGARFDDPFGSAYVFDVNGEDCNCNGVPDQSDDCNSNEISDEADIELGNSTDCNANCTPDECELVDCNETGVVDVCDIAEGTSNDCNWNTIPDECDLVDNTSEDCNVNQIPDECELDTDCDLNGIQDICDIANGTLHDEDDSGFPDECLCDGATYLLVPAGASGPHSITGNEIVLMGAGQRVFLEVHLCGWDPNLDGTPGLGCAWAKYDTSAFGNDASPSDLAHALQPCASDSQCEVILGHGSWCGFPEPGGGFCTPGFVDHYRPDWIGVSLPGTSGVCHTDNGFSLWMPDCGGCEIVDDGRIKYFGTLVLDVPEDALGAFTIGFLDEPSSGVVAYDGYSLPLKFSSVRITIGPTPVPAASQWGLVAMVLSVITVATIVIAQRRSPLRKTKA